MVRAQALLIDGRSGRSAPRVMIQSDSERHRSHDLLVLSQFVLQAEVTLSLSPVCGLKRPVTGT